MKYLMIMVVPALILAACCKPAMPLMDIEILDESGNNVLVGFTPNDSTWALVNHPTDAYGEPLQISNTNSKNVLLMNTGDIGSGADFYIRVNPTDVDTFNIEFELKGNCNLRIKVDHVWYNKRNFDPNKDDAISVVKY